MHWYCCFQVRRDRHWEAGLVQCRCHLTWRRSESCQMASGQWETPPGQSFPDPDWGRTALRRSLIETTWTVLALSTFQHSLLTWDLQVNAHMKQSSKNKHSTVSTGILCIEVDASSDKLEDVGKKHMSTHDTYIKKDHKDAKLIAATPLGPSPTSWLKVYLINVTQMCQMCSRVSVLFWRCTAAFWTRCKAQNKAWLTTTWRTWPFSKSCLERKGFTFDYCLNWKKVDLTIWLICLSSLKSSHLGKKLGASHMVPGTLGPLGECHRYQSIHTTKLHCFSHWSSKMNANHALMSFKQRNNDSAKDTLTCNMLLIQSLTLFSCC